MTEHADVPHRFREELGVLRYGQLKAIVSKQSPYLIDRLIGSRSVNILIGDSGIGKTPLAIQLGICVAAGCRFLGRLVRQERILYCDAESGPRQFQDTLANVSRFVGLKSPPLKFLVWSPNFGGPPEANTWLWRSLLTRVEVFRPKLVIVDPLRAFWPDAEEKTASAIRMIQQQREAARKYKCTWINVHHPRKRNFQNPVSLVNDRFEWFQEAAGSRALVNGTDSRLGVELNHQGRGELVLAGFVRSEGFIEPQYLERVCNESQHPQGYRVLSGADFLNDRYRSALTKLPSQFRFRDAHRLLGQTSSSATTAFVNQCVSFGLITSGGDGYSKTSLGREARPGTSD